MTRCAGRYVIIIQAHNNATHLKRHIELGAVFARPGRAQNLAKRTFPEFFMDLVCEFLLK